MSNSSLHSRGRRATHISRQETGKLIVSHGIVRLVTDAGAHTRCTCTYVGRLPEGQADVHDTHPGVGRLRFGAPYMQVDSRFDGAADRLHFMGPPTHPLQTGSNTLQVNPTFHRNKKNRLERSREGGTVQAPP